MKTIGVVTVSRSDYGIYTPVLRQFEKEPDVHLELVVSGTHLSPEFGMTVDAIEADGFRVGWRAPMLLSSDSPEGIVKSMGIGMMAFAQIFAQFEPDILMVLGDRFEMHAAALAALPFRIPVAHIHGGEITEGAIDDALRHSMTKLSHLHFVSAEEHARRVIQLGEEPWRVIVSGAPALDGILSAPRLSLPELERRYGLDLDVAPLLVTFHPVTLEFEHTRRYVTELLTALAGFDLPIIFSGANADTNGRLISAEIQHFVREHPRQSKFIENLGTTAYYSFMAIAAAMVGNSSSGLLEAPSFSLPAVNIGSRQARRLRAANVIDAGYASEEIRAAIARALDPSFRRSLRDMANPYGSGHAARIIAEQIAAAPCREVLIRKRFHGMAPA